MFSLIVQHEKVFPFQGDVSSDKRKRSEKNAWEEILPPPNPHPNPNPDPFPNPGPDPTPPPQPPVPPPTRPPIPKI